MAKFSIFWYAIKKVYFNLPFLAILDSKLQTLKFPKNTLNVNSSKYLAITAFRKNGFNINP